MAQLKDAKDSSNSPRFAAQNRLVQLRAQARPAVQGLTAHRAKVRVAVQSSALPAVAVPSHAVQAATRLRAGIAEAVQTEVHVSPLVDEAEGVIVGVVLGRKVVAVVSAQRLVLETMVRATLTSREAHWLALCFQPVA